MTKTNKLRKNIQEKKHTTAIFFSIGVTLLLFAGLYLFLSEQKDEIELLASAAGAFGLILAISGFIIQALDMREQKDMDRIREQEDSEKREYELLVSEMNEDLSKCVLNISYFLLASKDHVLARADNEDIRAAIAHAESLIMLNVTSGTITPGPVIALLALLNRGLGRGESESGISWFLNEMLEQGTDRPVNEQHEFNLRTNSPLLVDLDLLNQIDQYLDSVEALVSMEFKSASRKEALERFKKRDHIRLAAAFIDAIHRSIPTQAVPEDSSLGKLVRDKYRLNFPDRETGLYLEDDAA